MAIEQAPQSEFSKEKPTVRQVAIVSEQGGDRVLEPWEVAAWKNAVPPSNNGKGEAQQAAVPTETEETETAEKLTKMAEEAAAQVRTIAAAGRALLEKNNS